jgi:glycosyltransferase involved in cell wall biosynthesis
MHLRSLTSRREYSHDVIVAINYYLPHISGLTRTAQCVAEQLVGRGLRVKVVCQRHDKKLARRETVNGVEIERVPIIGRIENGLLSLTFPFRVVRAARHAKLLHLHLPMLEAGPIALLANRSPTVVTYQCDFVARGKFLSGLIRAVVDWSARVATRRARETVVSTRDYAAASRIAKSLTRATEVFPVVSDRRGGARTFRTSDGPHYGFLGRLTHEKGLVSLVKAFRDTAINDAVLLIAGPTPPHGDVSLGKFLSESARQDPRIKLLGEISESRIPDFYASLDFFVLPSTNRLEAFGITQAEAMVCGVPVITTDLPGVRTLVRRFGTGLVVPPGDIASLTAALLDVRLLPRSANDPLPLLESASEYSNLIVRRLQDADQSSLNMPEHEGRQPKDSQHKQAAVADN